ncbi:MAG: hypothetical protein J7L55_01670 [Desulfurococcales archaeon]|nr:hypothetical protein [Desulfurococcales archaeon]
MLVESPQTLKDVAGGLEDPFAGRYIPKFRVRPLIAPESSDAVIKWLRVGEGFELVSYDLSDVDHFEIRSAPPKPYVNESPYFFILQVLSRQYVKKGYLMLTDTVAIHNPRNGETHLFMGYPHTGKSTLLALSLGLGLRPLTTENTILEVRRGEAYVIGGTNILVFDPRIEEKYGVRLSPATRTKHGYGIKPLTGVAEGDAYRVTSLNIIYCSFSSTGANFKPVKGRKALKLLWHFATSVIRGTDYYEPAPPNLSDPALDLVIADLVRELATKYGKVFREAFGSHIEVLEAVFKGNSL